MLHWDKREAFHKFKTSTFLLKKNFQTFFQKSILSSSLLFFSIFRSHQKQKNVMLENVEEEEEAETDRLKIFFLQE